MFEFSVMLRIVKGLLASTELVSTAADILTPTGYMMNAERIIASPLMTIFGGTCCKPSAFLSKLSTITILVNDVTNIAASGKIASAEMPTMRTSGLVVSSTINF
jgi:hypothetical protein